MRAIYARSENGVLGLSGAMPWHCPTDLRFFKRTTMGHPVVMGLNTFAALRGLPLPGRHTVLLTRSPAMQQRFTGLDVTACGDPEDVRRRWPNAFVVGGPTLLSLFRPWITDLYETVVHTHIFSPDAVALPDDWAPRRDLAFGPYGPVQGEGDDFPMTFTRYHEWMGHTPVIGARLEAAA